MSWSPNSFREEKYHDKVSQSLSSETTWKLLKTAVVQTIYYCTAPNHMLYIKDTPAPWSPICCGHLAIWSLNFSILSTRKSQKWPYLYKKLECYVISWCQLDLSIDCMNYRHRTEKLNTCFCVGWLFFLFFLCFYKIRNVKIPIFWMFVIL